MCRDGKPPLPFDWQGRRSCYFDEQHDGRASGVLSFVQQAPQGQQPKGQSDGSSQHGPGQHPFGHDVAAAAALAAVGLSEIAKAKVKPTANRPSMSAVQNTSNLMRMNVLQIRK
jgi:hypothetical protein